MSDLDLVRGSVKRLRAWRTWNRVSSAQRRLLGDAAWVTLGQIVSALGMLVGMRLLTEFVSPDVFGTVSLLVGIATLGSTLLCTPQMQASVRFYPELARMNQVGRLRAVVVKSLRKTCALLAVLLLVGGAIWSRWTGLSYSAFVVLAALLAYGVFSTFEIGLLGAARRQKAAAAWIIADNCSRPGLGLLAILIFGATPTMLLGGYAVASAGILLVYRVASRQRRTASAPDDAGAVKALADEIHYYAKPLIPIAIVSWINALSSRYILGEISGAEQVGIYAAAYGLINRPFAMAGGMLLQTLRPVYYEAIADGDGPTERRMLRLWIGATLGLGVAGVLGVIFLRESIAELLLGAKYRSGAAIMPILAVGFALVNVSYVFNTICLAYKKTKCVLWSESGAAVGMIVLGVPAIVLLGLWGAALSMTAAYAIQAGLAIYLSRGVAEEGLLAASGQT